MTSEMFYVSSKATYFHHLKKFLKVHKLPVASQSISFLLLLLEECSLLWALASNTIFLYSSRSLATACKFLIIFKSSSAVSVHPFCDHHLFLVQSILAFTVCFGILSTFILSLCLYHLNLGDLILYLLICSFIGTQIFLTIFLSQTLNSIHFS
jgi:hypothetical protein